MEDNRTTMNTPLEEVLKDDFMQEIFVETDDGKAVKTYGKLAGLTNLGKTYFINWNEINKAQEYAKSQLKQEFGDEVFGKSAQLTTQNTNGTTSNTGKGSAIKNESSETGPLIDCSVSFLMDLPDKKKKLDESVVNEATGSFDQFIEKVNELQQYIQGKCKDEEWKKQHDSANTLNNLNDAVKGFSNAGGPSGEKNAESWDKFYKIFEAEPWKSEVTGDSPKDPKMKKITDEILKEWNNWGGDAPAQFGTGQSSTKGKGKGGSNAGQETDDEWHWRHTYRIDITTHFDENWFKRKFKSGLLNAAIRAIKTSVLSHGTQELKQKGEQYSNAGHKFTYDQMEPGEKRKLDGLQWKMTNKVAKQFIQNLLGWSRSKQKYIDEKTELPHPMQEQLSIDQKFGKQMADKALGDRGILGRLKQKLFAGGQSNNVISVAFQLADPNDGWKLVDEKTGEQIDAGEDGEGKEGGEGGPDGGGSGDMSGKGTGSGEKGGGTGAGTGSGGSSGGKNGGGAGSGANGKGGSSGGADGGVDGGTNEKGDLSLLQRVIKIEDKMVDNDLWGKVPHPPRTKNKYDDDKENTKDLGGKVKNNKNVAKESSDPFAGVIGCSDRIGSSRYDLVKKVCESGQSVDGLVDDCISNLV